MIYIGIDPGNSGAISYIYSNGRVKESIRLNGTEADILDQYINILREFPKGSGRVLLEKVWAMPKQGVSSSFKFGASYGFCLCLAMIANRAREFQFKKVTPSKWQTKMKCKTKGDKNVSKRKAQELFPDVKVIHANADSLLIAECARTFWDQL